MRRTTLFLLSLLAILSATNQAPAATLIFPQLRLAYYSAESIELAVAGVPKGASATVELVPQRATLTPIKFSLMGDGSTILAILPPYALAPSAYSVKVDGKEMAKLIIASGLRDSTMLLSQMANIDQLKPGGGNFGYGNAFEFGQFDPTGKGPKTTALRNPRGGSLGNFERGIAADLPTLVYMYWTGYVTHKAFGSEKSWAATDMTEAMRLLSIHAGQRLRRFAPNIISVGCIDEPGLSWGKTPAGSTASGFPNRDEVAWYEARGWKYTDDPAARPTSDWMKYMTIRCAIMKEQAAQAKKDLKLSWPDVTFSTDLYAPHAIMDGTDPLNQQVNDIPSSHVFVDFGIDRLGAYSGVMLEKAHDPKAKLAHAMNGQLFAATVKQPQQTYAYRAALNGMMAAGLASNWWLNMGGMTEKDLAAVNNPAKKIGALLRNFEQSGHDVAVLWSFTEIAMREKEITAREAKQKPGEQIKRTVAAPENSAVKSNELAESAYTVGGDYKDSVLTAHYALARAGYPAHIVDERLMNGEMLKPYKTLVIVGQTFEFPKEVRATIDSFQAAGGKVVVDKSTKIKLDGAIVVETNFKGLSDRWEALFVQDPKSFKSLKEASYFQTNYFMDEPVRNAVEPFKSAMKQTASKPRLEMESPDLLTERHFAGEGSITLVANAHKELPKIADGEAYPIYQYAPYDVKYRLKGLPEKDVVYVLEGADWSKTGRRADGAAEIHGVFEPAEMKVYLAAPRPYSGMEILQTKQDGWLKIKATLKDLKMPWPITVEINDANGRLLSKLHRATNAEGIYEETYAIGTNLTKLEVTISSPLEPGKSQTVGFDAGRDPTRTLTPKTLTDAVRVFDAAAIRKFLAEKPAVTIAYADAHKAQAESLAETLKGRGIKATIKPEMEVLKKVSYPRVWNPYAKVYKAGDKEPALEGKKMEAKLTLGLDREGVLTAKTADGKAAEDWHKPNSLVTIVGEGYVDWHGDQEICYEPGVQLFVDEKRSVSVVKGMAKEEATTAEFRAKWAKPWSQLTSHVGGYQLPAQLPECYTVDSHLIVLGDSTTSKAVAVLQASDLLLQVADKEYPGPGKALVSFVWSPFAVEKNVIVLAASDSEGIEAAMAMLGNIIGK